MAELEVREVRRNHGPPAAPPGQRRKDQHRREVLESILDADGNVLSQERVLFVREEGCDPSCIPGLWPFEDSTPCGSLLNKVVGNWNRDVDEPKRYEGILRRRDGIVFPFAFDRESQSGPNSRSLLMLDRGKIHCRDLTDSFTTIANEFVDGQRSG